MNVEELVREYIDKTIHMSLATASSNRPWVCEVHFSYDDNLNLYFVSKTDTRHCQELSRNPFVAGNIVAQHGLADSPHGIYFEGEAHLLVSPSEAEIHKYCKRLNRDPNELIEWLSDGVSGMYRIEVNNWAAFGKFGQDANKKYELEWNGGKGMHNES